MTHLKKSLGLLGIIIVVLIFQGCGGQVDVDWRNLDTPAKRYHFAQLSFEDLQNDYITMFPSQPEATKIYLRKNAAPVLRKAKLALDAWGEVIMVGVINIGQESAFTALFDDLALLLKPYIVKKN